MDRRDFIKLTGLSSLPLLMPGLVFGGGKGAAGRDLLIIVFQRGAADGLNLVVPYTEGHYYDARPTVAIADPGSNGGALDLDGFFGFHPQMQPLMPLYQSGDLAVVHAAGSPSDSRSHFDAQDFMEAGVVEKGSAYDGWLNRHLQTLGGGEGESPFQAVGFGQSLPVSLRGSIPAVGVAQLEDYGLVAPVAEEAALREAVVKLFSSQGAIDQVAGGVLDSVDLMAAADPLSIPVDNGALYPETVFGNQMQGLAKLIKADLGLEIAAVDIGGWDHHDLENEELPDLTADFAGSLAAFHADLGGMMDNITVITMTEFGRRLAENGNRGTDHGHGSIMLTMGGGVNGGQVYADWPGLAPADLNRGDLEVTTDFRSVLSEALVKRLGQSSIETVFPDFSGPTDLGVFR
ncbi:MAG: DUF1501 domain-containing protein [Xanthomonadales bacterium]|nr:DUF1501 domain-containing protein [Xanthomonadales bacterium]